MSNLLRFNSEARASLLKGLNTVADAVGITLGPKGKNAAIERINQPALIVHDGVTVARSITLTDPFENIGAQLLVATAQKTNDIAGDGTTTATILAQAIATECLKQIESGANPQTLKKGIETALKLVLEELYNLTKPIKTDEELEQVATISCADPVLGKLIAQAIKTVGTKGVVTVEEGNGFETTVEYKQGMEIDRGYLSPQFVTDDARVESIIDEPYILLTDLKISHNYEIAPLAENLLKAGIKNLVIFASTVDGEALATMVVNNLRGVMKLCAVQAPAFGGRRLDELEDMAALTGGKVITADSGRELESVLVEELGRAKKITSDRDKTIILDGKGNKKAIEARVKDISEQIAMANTDYDKEIKKQRLARLIGGVAVVNVGGVTEVEVKERKERLIDAVNATKAALEEGIVAGGEITLFYISGILASNLMDQTLIKALRKPFITLIENAGLDHATTISKLVGSAAKYPMGIDVMDGEVKDLIKAGIIDPVKVTRSALENAVSIATMLMTTSVIITDQRDEK